MKLTHTDYLIEKLREFNIPFPKFPIAKYEVKTIIHELKSIEDSITEFKDYLSKYKSKED
ncbi:hypothetical protein [Algibacter sp. L4_22]|uniref:hypothetical protein n=1 Tax=Algibacter sp. L4_22 TaxID=2942477 RepID=UPI00201B69D0|nr:hypothetical protein [Algibacter sp. L4_22]MCL5129092.1 hypothetical protein [Algibacter sp. L4_22]